MSNAAGARVARRRLVLGCFSVALTGGLTLLFVSGNPTGDTSKAASGAGGAALADSSRSFTIEGDATEPISPGVRVSLDLKLTNPHDTPVSVTNLRVNVQKVRAPNADAAHPCTVGDFAVEQASSSREITLPAGATGTLSSLGLPRATWPHVGMLNRPVDQDGCKAASLTLAYTASGTRGR